MKGVAVGWATNPFWGNHPKCYNLNLTSTSPTWHPPLPMREGDYDCLHFLVLDLNCNPSRWIPNVILPIALDLLLLSVGFLNGFKGCLFPISTSLTLKKEEKTLFYILQIPLFRTTMFACLNPNLFVDMGDFELKSYGVLVQRGTQDTVQSK
jgi:hypothetical protein